MAAKKRRKGGKKTRKARKAKGHIPLAILKKRLVKLTRVVNARS